MRNNKNLTEYSMLFLIVVISLAVFMNIKNREINFCKSVFSGLMQGRESIQKFIDWKNLKAMGVDAGRTYVDLADDRERENYRKAFIKNTASGFKQTKGRLNLFTNWRIYDRDIDTVVIAADSKINKRVLLFIISKYPKARMAEIEWQK